MGFGSKAVIEETKPVNIWHEVPQYDEVKNCFISVGSLKAKIELLELEITEVEREVKRGSKKADDIEAAKEASKDKRRELAETKAKLYEAVAYQDWLSFRKEIFKSVAYQTR